MWHAVAILLLHGAAGVTVVPATQLIIHDMVGPAQLQSAIRLNATTRYLAILLGPGRGRRPHAAARPGVWAPRERPDLRAVLDLPLGLPYTGHLHDGARARPAARLGLRDALRIFGEVRGDRRIVAMIVLGGVTSFFVGNAFQAQMPEYAHHLGADEAGAWYSVLLAANAAGAVLGAVLLESANVLRPSVRAAIVCAGVWGVAIGLFPPRPTTPSR